MFSMTTPQSAYVHPPPYSTHVTAIDSNQEDMQMGWQYYYFQLFRTFFLILSKYNNLARVAKRNIVECDFV